MPKIQIKNIHSKYIINENNQFTYISFLKNNFLPSEGWKIHISAYFDNFQNILNIVYNYCLKKAISFKFINNTELLSEIVGKNCDRYSACKFITLYFSSTKSFKNTCEDLYIILKNFNSGFVLSDKRYKDSGVIYYRYGEYFKKNNLSKQILLDYKPSHINDPFDSKPPKIRNSDVILNKKYKISSAIHFSNFGGVYCSNENIIIKEARPGTGESIINTSIKLRKNEFELINFLYKKNVNVPKAIEHFIQEEHHFFVYERLQGKTLNEYKLFQKLFHSKDSILKTKKKNYWKLFNGIIKEMKKVHKENIILNDISESNIFISKNKIYFIDLEHSYNLSNKSFDKKLLNYSDYTYHHQNSFGKDFQKLYYTILSSISGLNAYLQTEKSGKYVADIFSIFCNYTIISNENRNNILLNINNIENAKFKNNYNYNIDYDYIIKNIQKNINKIKIYLENFTVNLSQKVFYDYNTLKNDIEDLLSKIIIDDKIIYIRNNNILSPNLSNGTALLLQKILLFSDTFNNHNYLYIIKSLYKSILHNLSTKIDYLEGNLGIIHSLIYLYKFKKNNKIRNAILFRYSLFIEIFMLNQKYNIDYMFNYSKKRKEKEIIGLLTVYNEIVQIMEDLQ